MMYNLNSGMRIESNGLMLLLSVDINSWLVYTIPCKSNKFSFVFRQQLGIFHLQAKIGKGGICSFDEQAEWFIKD